VSSIRRDLDVRSIQRADAGGDHAPSVADAIQHAAVRGTSPFGRIQRRVSGRIQRRV
jgi:hypothetical protein